MGDSGSIGRERAGRERVERIYVSALIAEKVIPSADDEGLITLEGVGPSQWTTDGDSVVITSSEVFVTVHFYGTRLGAHTLRIRIDDEADHTILETDPRAIEVTGSTYVFTCTVPLSGICLPLGTSTLWVLIDGKPRTPVAVTVVRNDGSPPG
jgi:hypothetical protein